MEAGLKGLRGWNQALACRHAAPVGLDAARAFQDTRIKLDCCRGRALHQGA
jgi:hypothetical protein